MLRGYVSEGNDSIHTRKPKLRLRPCPPGKSIIPPGHMLPGALFPSQMPPLSLFLCLIFQSQTCLFSALSKTKEVSSQERLLSFLGNHSNSILFFFQGEIHII